MPANPRCWMRCGDCGHRQLERRSCVERRSRPRCAICGGFLYPSQAASEALKLGVERRRMEQEKAGRQQEA